MSLRSFSEHVPVGKRGRLVGRDLSATVASSSPHTAPKTILRHMPKEFPFHMPCLAVQHVCRIVTRTVRSLRILGHRPKNSNALLACCPTVRHLSEQGFVRLLHTTCLSFPSSSSFPMFTMSSASPPLDPQLEPPPVQRRAVCQEV